jgi:hypothetical protein
VVLGVEVVEPLLDAIVKFDGVFLGQDGVDDFRVYPIRSKGGNLTVRRRLRVFS